jgi:hypothetical protein
MVELQLYTLLAWWEWFHAPTALCTEIQPFVPLQYEVSLAPKRVWFLGKEKYLSYIKKMNHNLSLVS